MCLICVEYSKGKMTPDEGLAAFEETKDALGQKHADEVRAMLLEAWWNEYANSDWENMPQTD